MTLAELNPDVVLAEMLDGKVEVQTSATEKHTIKCYADNKQPNKNLDDEFIGILWNGGAEARTFPPAVSRATLRCRYSARLTLTTRPRRSVYVRFCANAR